MDAGTETVETQPQVIAEGSAPSDRVKVVYEVKPGDTLSSIAQLFKTTVASLRSWNKLTGSRINAGERLTVYVRRSDRNIG